MAATAFTKQADVGSDDEITIERRVRVPEADGEEVGARKTTKMGKVDARLIAIARGDVEPDNLFDLLLIDDPFGDLVPVDDPFGGLVPVYDDPTGSALDDDWLRVDDEHVAPSASSPASSAVPRLRMRAAAIVALPLDPRSGFLLSHIDGLRTVEEVIDVSNLSADDAREVMAVLVGLGAITID